MLRRKSEYAWKFLRENNCDDVTDNITNGMRCTICGKVMINAHIGGCGCRYCLECVTGYLNGESGFCPGNGDECEQELMVIGETVFVDHGMNREISKLIVKCPRDGCQFKGELGKMEEHERVCDKRAAKCPYSDIGCSQNPLVNDRIDEHLVRENESHAKLLVDCIGRLENEIGTMKIEIAGLTEERRQHQVEYAEVRARAETRAAEADQLRERCLLLEEKLGGLEQQAANETEERRRDLDEVRLNQTIFNRAVVRLRKNWINVENRERGEFMWCIDQWAARRQTALGDGSKRYIYSGAFHLHEQGYRMCLSASIAGYHSQDDMHVFWSLMRGPFDQHLSWPFRGNVTVSLINQETRLDHASYSMKYGWERPVTDRNSQYLSDTPFSMDEISRNNALCKNDQVLIRCVVEMTK